MAIKTVVQQGDWINIYDETDYNSGSIYAPDSQLIGFTSSSVTVKKGSWTTIYAEDGHPTDNKFSG